LEQEQFILPESVTVRDPQGNRYVIEGVLVILAIGIALFSYLKGLTVLLFCCLGVLLLALGTLLYDLFSRARPL